MRVVGYVRVSTEEQAREGLSLAEQERRIREFAAERGWECVEVFADRGVSGSVAFAGRPAGAETLAADAELIVVVAWDRLSRDAADFLTIVRDREVVSITEDGEPPLLRDLRAVLNQEERRKIRARTKSAAVEMAHQGRYNGPRPLGYRFAGGLIVPLEHEVPVVGRIFAEFVAGRSMRHVATRLNAEGITTARGRPWRSTSIRCVLTNPVYVGRIRLDGTEYPGRHEAILDAATWEKAQALLAATYKTRAKGRGRPTIGRHLFVRGMLRCECGEAMVPRTQRDHRGPMREHYLCGGRLSFGNCPAPAVARAEIDQAVYRYFEQVGLDVEATREAIAEAQDRRLAEIRALRTQAEREAQLAAERLARVRRDYADGELAATDWRGFREELGAERAAALAEAARLRASEAEVEATGVSLDAESATLRRLAEVRRAVAGEVQAAEGIEAVRAALTRLFEGFVLHRSVPERVHLELVGETWIEPIPRRGEGVWPGRTPLDQAGNKDQLPVGYTEYSTDLFGPILVGAGRGR